MVSKYLVSYLAELMEWWILMRMIEGLCFARYVRRALEYIQVFWAQWCSASFGANARRKGGNTPHDALIAEN